MPSGIKQNGFFSGKVFQKGHIPWNKKQIKIICKICKKIFYIRPSKIKRSKYCSWECRNKGISIGLQGNKRSINRIPWNRGKKLPQISGKNHPNWQGGITPIHLKIRNSIKYKKWRRGVFIRDHFTCQKCGHRFINIIAHHIKSFTEYKEFWFDINNGITLCKSCHIKLHKPQLSRHCPTRYT